MENNCDNKMENNCDNKMENNCDNKMKNNCDNKMKNNCDNILKIMKESFNQIEEYKNKRYNVILQTIDEKIEIVYCYSKYFLKKIS